MTKGAPFLRMPLELRQKVYRELLRPSLNTVQSRRRTRRVLKYDLQVSILRVNKQIHDEAMKVLHEENPVLLLHVHTESVRPLRNTPRVLTRELPYRCPAYLFRADGIGAEPVLQITVMPVSEYIKESDKIVLKTQPGPQWTTYVQRAGSMLPSFCRSLTSCRSKEEIYVSLYLPATENTVGQRSQESLLDCFQECRGVGGARIFDSQGSEVEMKNLTGLMVNPFTQFDEFYARACLYQERARQQLARGKVFESREILINAIFFLAWWLDMDTALRDKTHAKSDIYWEIKNQISWSCAFQSIELEDSHTARWQIKTLFRDLPLTRNPGPTVRALWEKESDGLYLKGRAQLIDGARNAALFSFLLALTRQPGHKGADKAIDELETLVKKSDVATDEIVGWNIEHVLKEFRHQIPVESTLSAAGIKNCGPANMNDIRVDELYQSFVGCFALFHSAEEDETVCVPPTNLTEC